MNELQPRGLPGEDVEADGSVCLNLLLRRQIPQGRKRNSSQALSSQVMSASRFTESTLLLELDTLCLFSFFLFSLPATVTGCDE